MFLVEAKSEFGRAKPKLGRAECKVGRTQPKLGRDEPEFGRVKTHVLASRAEPTPHSWQSRRSAQDPLGPMSSAGSSDATEPQTLQGEPPSLGLFFFGTVRAGASPVPVTASRLRWTRMVVSPALVGCVRAARPLVAAGQCARSPGGGVAAIGFPECVWKANPTSRKNGMLGHRARVP